MRARQCSSPGGLSAGVRPGRTGCLSERLGRKAMILGRQDGVGDTITTQGRRQRIRSDPLPGANHSLTPLSAPKLTRFGAASLRRQGANDGAPPVFPPRPGASPRLGMEGSTRPPSCPLWQPPRAIKGGPWARGEGDRIQDDSSHHKLEGEVRLGREVISPGGSALRVARATHHESPGNLPCSSTMILSTTMQE